jgi:class 3 adenylate cyclase/pimeloyl-ACP methyl ester carboxylesterase
VRPQTQYARSGDLYVGYQVFGDGPFDLVAAPGALSNIEYGWELESWRDFYGAFASFARVILFDKRGTGISDPAVGAPSLEERMDDVRAVLDAVGSERAALMGSSDGAAMVALFAATYPERTAALVLNNPLVRGAWAPDYPWGAREDEEAPSFPGTSYATPAHVEATISAICPSRRGDEAFAQWIASYMRLCASPTTRDNLLRMNLRIDVREVLSTIRAPTLVIHREVPSVAGQRRYQGPLLPAIVEASRYVADRIAGARFAELPPGDIAAWAGDFDDPLHFTREFLTGAWETGAWEPGEPDRVLSTLLFTDIVGSTARATELGDARWRELLEQHHSRVRQQLARFRGRELDTVGDGFFASFDGPARAVRCACAIGEGVKDLGLEVRAGLHAGECELIDGKIGGIAVHIGARVAGAASPGEVLVSSTVKDLVAGSGLEFEERGTHELKGIPGNWRLFAVRR